MRPLDWASQYLGVPEGKLGKKMNQVLKICLTLLLYRGGIFCPPYQKMAITPKNNDLKEPKLCEFYYISMTLPYPSGGSKWRYLLAVPILGL